MTVESAPNTSVVDQNKVFDAGYSKGANKARREIAEKLGLQTPDEIDRWIEAQRTEQQKKLEEEGRYKEALALREKELASEREARQKAESRVNEAIFSSQFAAEAHKAGIVDSQVALMLVGNEERKLDDRGNAVGLSEIIARIVREKPYLVSKGDAGPIGTAGNGSGSSDQASEKAKKLADLRSQLDAAKKDPSKRAMMFTLARQIQDIERGA